MGKEKNNKILIIIMGIIIVILSVLCILFATDTIILNNNTNKTSDNESNKDKNNNLETTLSNEQAQNIVSELFENDTVRRILDNGQLTYCNYSEDSKVYTEKELGLDYEWNGLNKCDNYNSYDELINYFKNFFTNEYFNNNIKDKKAIATKSETMPDGIVMYNYYEKDGYLYAANTGKGSNVGKEKINEINYIINNITDNTITASVNITWLDVNSNNTMENINISLEKINNIWKISDYSIQ